MTSGFLARNLLSLLSRRKLHFQFDRIPLVAEDVSMKKLLNLFRIGLNRLLSLSPALGFPYMAHVSPSGLCDLRCPLCPTQNPQARGKTLLSLQTYRKLLDEIGDYLIYVIMWSWGEPFLNPALPAMIAQAKERNILTVTSTNLNRLNRGQAREIVASGLDALIIALDGTTEESHSRYRSGGSAARVIENTRLLLEERKRSGKATPFVNLRMVVSKDNEGEVEGFRSLAGELGVDMVSFKAFATRQLGRADPRLERRYAPGSDRYRWYKYRPDYSVDTQAGKYKCKFPWTKPTLFADGEVLSCEYDFAYSHSFGNLNEQNFREIWFGRRATEFRKAFRKDRDAIAFCRDCVYDHKLITGCVLDWEILRS